MAWDGYRDSLTGSKNVYRAALCGLDGAIWTQSDGFNLTPEEVKNLINGFSNPDFLRASGIKLGGEKYIYLQSDDKQMQGKKSSTGCAIAKSLKCIVIGVYDQGQQPGNARKAVETMRDHLLEHSY